MFTGEDHFKKDHGAQLVAVGLWNIPTFFSVWVVGCCHRPHRAKILTQIFQRRMFPTAFTEVFQACELVHM